MFKRLLKISGLSLLLILLWQLAVMGFALPHYMLPTPLTVFEQIFSQFPLLWQHSQITFIEIIVGLSLGFLLGVMSALALSLSNWLNGFYYHY
ncbi:ABC transporter permease [Actinobacillus equuli]|nr:ABC transporter permease [Actinobacillus equuli]